MPPPTVSVLSVLRPDNPQLWYRPVKGRRGVLRTTLQRGDHQMPQPAAQKKLLEVARVNAICIPSGSPSEGLIRKPVGQAKLRHLRLEPSAGRRRRRPHSTFAMTSKAKSKVCGSKFSISLIARWTTVLSGQPMLHCWIQFTNVW
jgi:hypothetical protein